MNVVDRYRWSDGGGCVAPCRNQAGAEEDSDISTPAVFEGGRQLESVAGAGVKPDRGSIGIENVESGHRRVRLMTIDCVERQHPAPRQAVFEGAVDEDGSTGCGVSAKTCAGAIHADIVHVHAA